MGQRCWHSQSELGTARLPRRGRERSLCGKYPQLYQVPRTCLSHPPRSRGGCSSLPRSAAPASSACAPGIHPAPRTQLVCSLPKARYQPAGGCWRPLGSQTRTFWSSELPGSCLSPRSGTREGRPWCAPPGSRVASVGGRLGHSSRGLHAPRWRRPGPGWLLSRCCPHPPKPRRLAFAVPAPTLSGCEITKKVGRKGREKGTARRE